MNLIIAAAGTLLGTYIAYSAGWQGLIATFTLWASGIWLAYAVIRSATRPHKPT